MEIRTIGQQYTILVDGEMINQFDNAIPKVASRAGDPPTMARQFAQGYLGLQTHGGNDRISYREMQVKEIARERHPGQHGRAVGHQRQPGGIAYTGKPLTCNHGTWNRPRARRTTRAGTARTRSRRPSRACRAPSQLDYGNITTPAEPSTAPRA